MPYKGTVYRMVGTSWQTGSVLDRNIVRKRYVLTEVVCQNPHSRVQQYFQKYAPIKLGLYNSLFLNIGMQEAGIAGCFRN